MWYLKTVNVYFMHALQVFKSWKRTSIFCNTTCIPFLFRGVVLWGTKRATMRKQEHWNKSTESLVSLLRSHPAHAYSWVSWSAGVQTIQQPVILEATNVLYSTCMPVKLDLHLTYTTDCTNPTIKFCITSVRPQVSPVFSPRYPQYSPSGILVFSTQCP